MSTLSRIKGIGTASQTLLEAAGIQGIGALATADIDTLTRQIADRNQALKILKRTPRRSDVETWVIAARELAPAVNGSATVPKAPETPPETVHEPHLAAPSAPVEFMDAPSLMPPPAPNGGSQLGAHPGATVILDHHPDHDADEATEVIPLRFSSDDLTSIPGIDRQTLELLQAIGISTVTGLAHSEIGEISVELERANRLLRLAKRAPNRVEIGKWIAAALELTGHHEDETGGSFAEPFATPAEPGPLADGAASQGEVPLVNYEATEHVQELLAVAHLAIPLPAQALKEAGVKVAEIAPAILLTEYAGDLDVRVTDRAASPLSRNRPGAGTAPPAASFIRIASAASQRQAIDPTRFRKFDEPIDPRQIIAPSSSPDITPENDRVALIRAPLAETNLGRDPRSRRYIRGVLHTRPWGMVLGAAVTLLMMAVLMPALAAASLLLLSVLAPDSFEWIPPWLPVLPCCLPVVGIPYLILGSRARCQVCGQRMFFRRSCLKNSKAHHIPGLGYIVSVSLHMLLFRWFRCTFCGTPIRLKK